MSEHQSESQESINTKLRLDIQKAFVEAIPIVEHERQLNEFIKSDKGYVGVQTPEELITILEINRQIAFPNMSDEWIKFEVQNLKEHINEGKRLYGNDVNYEYGIQYVVLDDGFIALIPMYVVFPPENIDTQIIQENMQKIAEAPEKMHMKRKQEQRLKSIFPIKERFFKSQKEYIEKNFQEIFENVKKELFEEDEETLRYVTHAVTRAFHTAEIFLDAVPAHLLEGSSELKVDFVKIANHEIGGISNAFLKIDDRENVSMKDLSFEDLANGQEISVTKVYALINLLNILHEVKAVLKSKQKDDVFYLSLPEGEIKDTAMSLSTQIFTKKS